MTLEPMKFADAPSRARRVLVNGDVLISTVRTYLRAITHIDKVNRNLICSTGFAVLSAGQKVIPRFLSYWVRSSYFVDEVVAISVGVSYPAINASDIGSLPFPVIELSEQRAIASFLDRETGRIDALIEKKERQIELLGEKRAALISHAVTKGLNPNVKIKPSGIEWLGDIPERWEVKRLKHCADLINAKIDGSNSDLPYTGLENIESWTGKRIIIKENPTSEGKSSCFKTGDVLFGKLRPYLAKVFRCTEEGICTGELLVLRPKAVNQEHLFYYMLARDFIYIVDSSTYGVKMPRASCNTVHLSQIGL